MFVSAILNDPDVNVFMRAHAVKALAGIAERGDVGAVAAVSARLQDSDEDVRTEADEDKQFEIR